MHPDPAASPAAQGDLSRAQRSARHVRVARLIAVDPADHVNQPDVALTAILDDVSGPLVEILYFEGCPNHQGARELVERLAGDLGIEPEVRLGDVQTAADAQRLRFLGSPTIRVNGRDVEPDADERREFVHSCRVYPTDSGLAGQPDERWVRDALADTHAD